MSGPPTLLSALHDLSASILDESLTDAAFLSAHGPRAVGHGPNSASVAPSRDAFKKQLGAIRIALEAFKEMWQDGGEDGRVRATGLMKELTASSQPLLSLPPLLASLINPAASSAHVRTALFPSSPNTPFAYPLSSSPLAVIEACAKSAGLEVFSEATPAESDGLTQKDLLILGGPVIAVEIELEGLSVEEASVAQWRIVKFESSLNLASTSASEPLRSASLDDLLRPPMERIVSLISSSSSSSVALPSPSSADTIPLQLGRAAIQLEQVFADISLVERVILADPERADLFAEATPLREQLSAKLDLPSIDTSRVFPTFSLVNSHVNLPHPWTDQSQTVRLEPTPLAQSIAFRLPLELLSSSIPSSEDGAGPWGWTAVFDPPLVVGVAARSKHDYVGTWSRLLRQQALRSTSLVGGLTEHSFWSPPSGLEDGSSRLGQMWSFADVPAVDGVAISRVNLSGPDEAARVIEWARCWTSVNNLWLAAFNHPADAPAPALAIQVDEDDLDSLMSRPPPCTPVHFHLTPSPRPSIALTFPHPTGSHNLVTLDLVPSSHGPPTLTCSTVNGLAPETLAALSALLGGWPQGLLLATLKRLARVEEIGAGAEKRKREESSGTGTEGEETEEGERKRVKPNEMGGEDVA